MSFVGANLTFTLLNMNMKRKHLINLFIIGTSLLFATGFKVGGVDLGAAKDAVKAATLSEADAVKLGQEAIVSMDAAQSVAGADNPYTQRLDKLLANHKSDAYNFKVYLADDVNAFATPDGSIRVYSGLMDLMNDDELLAVLGHEMAHVELKHTLKSLKKAYAVSAARKGVASQSSGAGAIASSELGALGENMLNSSFSRSEETAADDWGLKFLQDNNYNAEGMVTAFEKLAEIDNTGSLLSSHPKTAKRAKRIKKKIK